MADGHPKVDVIRWTGAELPEAVSALISEAMDTGHIWASDICAAWRTRPFLGRGEALLLASDGHQLLAMAVISADPHVDDPDVGRLRFIYVRRSARRQGLADRLVGACLERAGKRWRRIRLHTDSAIAARLYERHGFHPSETDPRATHTLDLSDSGSVLAKTVAPGSGK